MASHRRPGPAPESQGETVGAMPRAAVITPAVQRLGIHRGTG